jgi:hypothetical protein
MGFLAPTSEPRRPAQRGEGVVISARPCWHEPALQQQQRSRSSHGAWPGDVRHGMSITRPRTTASSWTWGSELDDEGGPRCNRQLVAGLGEPPVEPVPAPGCIGLTRSRQGTGERLTAIQASSSSGQPSRQRAEGAPHDCPRCGVAARKGEAVVLASLPDSISGTKFTGRKHEQRQASGDRGRVLGA